MIKVNGILLKRKIWAGGEVHCKVDMLSDKYKIEATLHSSEDIMELLLIVDAIRRNHLRAEIELHIPYLPYARQDRVCEKGEPFSLKVMANLINSIDAEVHLYDPHSMVSEALINNVIVHSQYDNLSYRVGDFDTLIAPDAGAYKKILGYNKNTVYANKIRTPSGVEYVGISGELIGNCLVIDDICDGGRTFISLAKLLPKNTSLYVTHGIFSYGIETLLSCYENIYCAFPWISDSRIKEWKYEN